MVSEESPGNPVLALYRRYVGEPARERDVYLGFALFFGGITLGAVGLVLFLSSTGLDPRNVLFWQLREVALVAAFLGLPAFVLSVIVLLPVSRRARLAGAAGAALCLVAVGWFVVVYPEQWNVRTGPDYSAQGIALYAAGLAVLAGATGAALVGQYLERARATAAAGAEADPDTAGAGTASGTPTSGRRDADVSDAQVRRDIEESMADAELSWGGVRKRETKRLQITTPDLEPDERASFDRSSAKTARSAGTDDAVAGLRHLQGGERKMAAGSGTDDQLEALARLQAERAAEDEEAPGSVFDQVRSRLGL